MADDAALNVFAMDGGKRLDVCARDLQGEIEARPMTPDDKVSARLALRIPKAELTGHGWPNSAVSFAVAEWLLSEAAGAGHLKLWIMEQARPVALEMGDASPNWSATIAAGRYTSNEDPQSVAAGSYLYISESDWRPFLKATLAARDKSVPALPPLPIASFDKWVTTLPPGHQHSLPALLNMCRSEFPGHHISRERIRKQFGGGKPGPRTSAAK